MTLAWLFSILAYTKLLKGPALCVNALATRLGVTQGAVTHIQTIYVQARSAELLNTGEKEIRELLRQRHRLRDKPDDFTIQNQATLVDTERETTRSMTFLIGSVAGISLVVGGIGILAVMLISVRERTGEIGLRRAVGARRSDIRTQFLLESGLLAAAGGLLGVIGSVGAALGVSWLGYWDTGISWDAAVVGFAFSVSVGIVFGIYPASGGVALRFVDQGQMCIVPHLQCSREYDQVVVAICVELLTPNLAAITGRHVSKVCLDLFDGLCRPVVGNPREAVVVT